MTWQEECLRPSVVRDYEASRQLPDRSNRHLLLTLAATEMAKNQQQQARMCAIIQNLLTNFIGIFKN
ncbi:hypothetical protein [Nostoc sp.]|uniref:hypothetical protein n=1 Tax=Nostoc sp. TaxID=1180 RepID=UPI002FF994EB